jgi:pantetheine-phosphate adenylyltransferase
MSIAVVSGSFDPITLGHIHVIKEAQKMAHEVIVLVADNPDKKYFFDHDERYDLVVDSINEQLGLTGITIAFLPENTFTANVAKQFGADVIVRGLRNVVDFEYEHGQQMVNFAIEPEVSTVFVMPPPDLVAVSSSMIRGMVKINGWEKVAKKYLPKAALKALKAKVK